MMFVGTEKQNICWNYLELFRKGLGDLKGKTILDFGCGIGRLSKALLENFDCCVLGVDISASMRQLALEYVNNDRFSVISYEIFSELAGKGALQVDTGLAVYVLQHVYDPKGDIKLLSQAIRCSRLAGAAGYSGKGTGA